MARAHLPIQSITHQKEEESRLRFSNLLSPWIVRHCFENDYGIDVGVEITLAIGKSEDRLVSGKKFDIQLKSSGKSKEGSNIKSISIPVTKINYWYNSNLPTMLCYFDEKEHSFYYIWIDEDLINRLNNKNPKWVGQDSITINLERKLEDSLSDIERYVYHWKRPNRLIISAGRYFHFNNEIINLIDNLLLVSEESNDNYLPSTIYRLKKDLSKAIYSIAVAGQSRAGKSSLINAIVGKEISPVGILPTTGVPLCILPGLKEECEVLFQDGKVEKGEVSMEFIEQFANQKKNRRNKKKVKLISAKIINQDFENGIALYDIPGLNDPNEGIRNLSNTVILKSHAIIYVISAAPMASGEFILSNEIVSDLDKLKNSAEKIFIVINKVDNLNGDLLNQLKEYLNEEFLEYQINTYHPSEPFYLSAIGKKGSIEEIDTVDDLNNRVWDFLLSQKKTGLHRLFSALNQANESIIQSISISESRLLNTKQSKKVQDDIKEVSLQLWEKGTRITKYKKGIFRRIEMLIKRKKKGILNKLEVEMKKIPLNQSLFSKQDINNYLITESEKLSLEIQQLFNSEIIRIENEINIWIKNKLRQVQLEITKNNDLLATENNNFAWLIHNQLGVNESENFLQLLIKLILDSFNNLAILAETMVKGKEEMRNKKIQTIYNDSQNALDNIFSNITDQMRTKYDTVSGDIFTKTYERAKIYLSSLEEELKKTDTPLSDEELQNLNKYMKKLKEFQSKIKSLELQIDEQVHGLKTTES